MAIFPGLFGPRNNAQRQLAELTNQVAGLQNNFSYIQNVNAQLQQLLAINFRAQGGFERFDSVNQTALILDGYNASSAVYSIVSDITQKAASVPFKVSEVIDDYALKNYKLAVKHGDKYDIYRLRKKALKQVDQQHPLQKLCNDPCPDMDSNLFWQTALGFDLICGNSFLYTPRLDMGADKGKVTELQIMPSPFTALIVVQGYPPKVIGYELIIAGVQLLRTDEVIHIKQPNYNWTIDGLQLYGLPPLQAGRKTLQRSNSAETSSTWMFENGGPGVIVYNEQVPPTAASLEMMSKLTANNNNQYAGNENRGKVKYQPGKVGVAPLGLSPVDLNILESEKFSFDSLCNVFHLHSVLYNIHVSSNFNNIEQLNKDNWTSGYLPPRQRQADAINRSIVPDYNTPKAKYFVELDVSGIEALQPNRTEMATWLGASWWITPNQKLEIQGMEQSDDPNMEKIWLPQGLVTMDDAAINVDALPNMPPDQQPIGNGQQATGNQGKSDDGGFIPLDKLNILFAKHDTNGVA